MKSFFFDRHKVFDLFYQDFFSFVSREDILRTAVKLVTDLRAIPNVTLIEAEEALAILLSKTETYNTLLTLLELEKQLEKDEELQKTIKDPLYNQHRVIANSICDMNGFGATSFYGYLDCSFSSFFPQRLPNSFVSKGICALAASTAQAILSNREEHRYTEQNLALLASRQIPLHALSQLVLDLQLPYNPSLTLHECEAHVLGVLRKQETFHTIQLCTKIDAGIESLQFHPQFQAIVSNDEGLYGIDEAINTTVSKLYGMIAITNFGYLDKLKPGIIGELDSDHENDRCNTFLDDTVCAIVAAACARLAYNNQLTQSKPEKK